MRFLPALCIALCLAGVAHDAAAGSLYDEFGGGLAKFSDTSPFFGSSAEGSSGLGYSLSNALLFTLGRTGGPLAIQLGVEYRISSASEGDSNYGIETAYPTLRLQLSRLFVGVGYTPFVWRRISPESGFYDFSRAPDTSAVLAEAGLLWPITRKFSLGSSLGAQVIDASGVESPKPAWDGSVFLRVYFGFFGSRSSDDSSDEFEGRYPFGEMR